MNIDEQVILIEYNSQWPSLYLKESLLLQKILGQKIKSIDHVGSTAIPGISAKPIIDILIGVESLDNSNNFDDLLSRENYEKQIVADQFFPNRLFFIKIDKDSKQQFNLHITKHKGNFWIQLILFRDYLLNHPETVKEYEVVKQHMAQRFPNNLIAYSIGKEGFIVAVIERAKKEIIFGNNAVISNNK